MIEENIKLNAIGKPIIKLKKKQIKKTIKPNDNFMNLLK